MGILEIHFHDSEFSWTVNPRGSDEKTFSLDAGESASSGSKGSRTKSTSGARTGGGSGAQKLWMLGALALFVGLGLGFGKLRDRRRGSGKSETGSSGRRLSLSRSK